MQFKDSEGKEWTPRVTVETIARFEERTGRGLFAAVFDALEATPDGEDLAVEKAFPMAKLVRLCKATFGNVGHIGAFLYESCGAEKEGLSLSEFRERLTRDVSMDAIKAAMFALFNFFPQAEDDEGERSAEGRGPDFNVDLSSGDPSTSSPE
jgi:hypothetical protein